MMSTPLRRRLVAALYGAVCHGVFAFALALMVTGLYTGLQSGFGRLHGHAAVAANALLVAQFPVLHSLMLTRRGRELLARCAPRGYGATLTPTLYALFASLQLVAVFGLWSPSGAVLWRPAGAQLALHVAVFAGAWLFLGKALLDAGLGLQTGWIGWTAAWRGGAPRYPRLPEDGLFAGCRQPIYLGFALTLFTAPTWTPDRLGLALAWGAYCALGPLHKERRFAAVYGEAFEDYRRRVPYLLPKIFR